MFCHARSNKVASRFYKADWGFLLDVHLMYLSIGCGDASQSSAEKVCGTKPMLSRREDREKNAECYLSDGDGADLGAMWQCGFVFMSAGRA